MFEHFMGNESAIWGADAIDLTAYATYIRGTRIGMWALDSEDGDVVAPLDNLQSDSLTSNYLGFASRASRLNHSC
jgi:glutathione synthase